MLFPNAHTHFFAYSICHIQLCAAVTFNNRIQRVQKRITSAQRAHFSVVCARKKAKKKKETRPNSIHKSKSFVARAQFECIQPLNSNIMPKIRFTSIENSFKSSKYSRARTILIRWYLAFQTPSHNFVRTKKPMNRR